MFKSVVVREFKTMGFVRGAVFVLSLGVAMVLQATAASAENKLAFVVGVDAYKNLRSDAQLHHAVNDAEAVGAAFKADGFTVTQLTGDVTLSTLLTKFGTFTETITAGDTVAFYFAGHGIALADGTYLLPGDVPVLGPNDQFLAKRSGLSQKEISEGIQSRSAGAVIIVLDSCRDNPFAQGGTRAIGSATRGLSRLTATEGVFTLYSARENQTALDGLSDGDVNPNSVFTRTFVKYLRTPGLSLSDVGEKVRDDTAMLARSVGHDQVPSVSNDLIGASRLYLAGPPGATAPAPADARQTAAPTFCSRGDEYDKAMESQGVDAIRSYLQRCSPSGEYSQRASQEFESRLYLAASDCIRTSNGCGFDGCLQIYLSDLPNGVRAASLASMAERQVASRSTCRPTDRSAGEAPKEASLESAPEQTTSLAPAPSFTPPAWCRTASRLKPTEDLICSDAQVADLDSKLNDAFKTRIDRLEGGRRLDLQREEGRWIQNRDGSCGFMSRVSMKTCLVSMMEQRIASLRGAGGRQTPSFNPPGWCATAHHLKSTESMICSDAELSGLDADLTEAYQSKLQTLSGSGRVRLAAVERDWVAGRDGRCGVLASNAMRSCLVGMTRGRVEALRR